MLRDKQVISFRTLSSQLGIPTKQAQHVILEYINNHGDKIVPSWAVTSVIDSIKRVSLVQGKRPAVDDTTIFVAVWGIRSSLPVADIKNDVECWMGSDRLRELGYLKNSTVGSSQLHVNSWNPIKSGTAAWNTKGASATQVKVEKDVKSEPPKPSKNGFNSDIVTKVKAEAAAKRNGRKGNGIQFKPKSSNGKKMDSKSLGSRSKVKKEKAPPAPVAKKSRRKRIVESDDDDSDDDDDFEEKQCEREAMENEQREAEQAEIEREALKSQQKEEDDVSADEVEFIGTKKDRSQRQASGQKRTFGEQFGAGSNQQKKKYRMIEVEETVQKDNGYIETVRVKKYVDDDGNEKPAGESEEMATDGNTVDNDEVVFVEKAESVPKKKEVEAPRAKKEKAANGKANGSAKKKKSNGSIKSFFKKK